MTSWTVFTVLSFYQLQQLQKLQARYNAFVYRAKTVHTANLYQGVLCFQKVANFYGTQISLYLLLGSRDLAQLRPP